MKNIGLKYTDTQGIDFNESRKNRVRDYLIGNGAGGDGFDPAPFRPA